MRELVDGNTAVVRGALDAGCDFFAGYPITPASPILQAMMQELPRLGGVAVQGEDEIASIGMCIGAAMTGARALTATSGPGLSLYSENLGLAIMGEVPLVVVDVQRLGPATGGATTVGQGDVQFVRWGTSGGFPVIALAPSTVAECYELTREAFALAARLRTPVFVLTDKELGMTLNTVELGAAGDGAFPPIARRGDPAVPPPVDPSTDGASDHLTDQSTDQSAHQLAPGPTAPATSPADPPTAPAAGSKLSPFRPYRYEPADQVPPLVPLGAAELVRFTGSTHDERAFLTKDAPTVARLNEHLRAKIEDHAAELERVTVDAEAGASTLWIAYGVTAGAMRAAARLARAQGARVSTATVQSLWPVPEQTLAALLRDHPRVVVAELNHGQYRREIERLAGPRRVHGLHRVDGRLLAPGDFLATLDLASTPGSAADSAARATEGSTKATSAGTADALAGVLLTTTDTAARTTNTSLQPPGEDEAPTQVHPPETVHAGAPTDRG